MASVRSNPTRKPLLRWMGRNFAAYQGSIMVSVNLRFVDGVTHETLIKSQHEIESLIGNAAGVQRPRLFHQEK